MSRQYSDRLWLTGILAIAIVLRVIELDAGLWYDEIVTLVEYVRLPTMELVTTYTYLNNHVLYSLEAQLAIALFGEHAWTLRLPAFLFGVAGVAALWVVARQVVSTWEAHLTALLLAVSYHHIWFSQNARGYTGLLFWSLVAIGFFLWAMRRPSWAVWTGFAVALALAMYTHLSAGFFFAAMAVVYGALFLRRTFALGRPAAAPDDRYAHVSGWLPFFGFAFGGILAIAFHGPLIPDILARIGDMAVPAESGAEVTEWRNPLWTVLDVFRSVLNLGPLAAVGLPFVLVFVTVGAISLSKKHPVFTAFFLVHIPLTLVILLALSFRIWPRYFFVDIGFVFLCLVHGVFLASEFLARHLKLSERIGLSGRSAGIAASLAAALCSTVLLPANYRTPKQDFLGARDFVEASRGDGDVAASVGLASTAFRTYYAPEWEVVATRQELNGLVARPGRTWLVYGFSDHTEVNYPEIVGALGTDFEMVREFPGTLGGGYIFVYRSRE